MKINVISLKSSIDRQQKFANLNSHIDYEFFDAVDGNNLPEELYYNPELIDHSTNQYAPGALGVAFSHLALWNKSIETNQPITIAEDDAIFRLDFNDAANRLLSEINEWDIIFWGYNFDSMIEFNFMSGSSPMIAGFNQNKLNESIEVFRTNTDKNLLLGITQFSGCLGYTISPNGAKKYKQQCFPLTSTIKQIILPFSEIKFNLGGFGIDEAMSRANYTGTIKAYAAFPPIAVSENIKETSQTLLML